MSLLISIRDLLSYMPDKEAHIVSENNNKGWKRLYVGKDGEGGCVSNFSLNVFKIALKKRLLLTQILSKRYT